MKTTLFFLTLILGTLTIRRDPETGEFYEQNPLMEDILHLQWHLKPCKETPPTRPPSPTTTTITEARTINNYYNIFLTLIETSTMIKNPDTGPDSTKWLFGRFGRPSHLSRVLAVCTLEEPFCVVLEYLDYTEI
uniref:Lipocalin n=1 Tax=Daphnia galeata TaxID=27404 RepID=A0A8J2RQP0_9CRUS|nr:unnamed protein product [Daphnia galeata]